MKMHTTNTDLENCLSTFQLSKKDLAAAYSGDAATLKELGIKSQKARELTELAPKIAKHITDIVEGTVALEQANSTILASAGKGDLEVKKAIAATTLNGDKYSHHLKENAAKFTADADLEKSRHTHAFGYAAVLAQIAANTQQVEQQYQMSDTSQRLNQKQVEHDYLHSQKQNLEYLEKGAIARELPRKDFLSGLKSVGRALGLGG